MRVELFRLRARHWRTQLAGAVLLTLVVAGIFDRYAPDWRMWAWAGAICTICAIQAWLCRTLDRAPPGQDMSPAWWRVTHVLAVGIGILWSSPAWLLPADDATLQLLAGLTSAVVVLAAASASTSRALLLAVVIPAFALIPTAMLWHAHLPIAAAAAVVLLVISVQHGMSLERALLDTIAMRHRADALAQTLRVEQERRQEVLRKEMILDERQRMMRDLHDGLGSTLVSALVAMERGNLPPPALAGILRDCIDDLRIAIDSSEPIGHDLALVLGTMRHRLGHRLKAAGLGLVWEVGELPPLQWMGPRETMQVMRMVQEVLANVLKHAQARSVRVTTRAVGEQPANVSIEIEDDGTGFDLDAKTAGRGIAHLRARARQLDAALDIRSSPGSGTRVTLTLPASRPEAASPPTGLLTA